MKQSQTSKNLKEKDDYKKSEKKNNQERLGSLGSTACISYAVVDTADYHVVKRKITRL